MKIDQIYTGCLAQGTYYIQSGDEAVIIDPLRETQPYMDRAAKEGVTIKYIFETHFHADFVSGHLDLAKKTGAQIVFGPNAETDYSILLAKDGDEFEVGKVKIRVLHTPGHTMESTTYLLLDEGGREHAIFSGDTLFIGDVGRPDLAIKSDRTKEDLAGFLFDSLRNRIMTLPDDVIVYPAHGAGSACGKNMSKETSDTLGNQKINNYALRSDMTREEFIKEVTTGILPPPQYFAKNAMLNKSGYESLDDVMKKGLVALDVDTFEAMATHEGALVLDTRHQDSFVKGHIPNSIFIGIDGSFAPWVGALIPDLKQPIIIVAEEGRAEEVIVRLSRVGYDNTLGFLEGGFEAWFDQQKEISTIDSIDAADLEEVLTKPEHDVVLDVRKPGEFAAEHVEGAKSFPLDYINDQMDQVEAKNTYFIHCAGGYRSVIAASILKSRGFDHVIDIAHGYAGVSKTNIPRTNFVCPSTNK